MFDLKFGTMTGVHLHFEEQGVAPERGRCEGCRTEHSLYPWPLPGFGMRCASCIVIDSQKSDADA